MGRPAGGFRRRAALLLSLAAAPVPAQQFVTEEAMLVDLGACKLEGWVGQASAWVQPACHVFRNLEVAAGIGSLRLPGGRATEYFVHGKKLFRTLDRGVVAWGVVLGAGLDPIAQLSGEPAPGYFSYIPVTVEVVKDRILAHHNLAWSFERDEDRHGRHLLTWAFRADVLLGRFVPIGEYFSDTGSGAEFQLGIRTVVLPGRLEVELSYGWPRSVEGTGAGVTLGVTWTPGWRFRNAPRSSGGRRPWGPRTPSGPLPR